jgi:hypothetical protein
MSNKLIKQPSPLDVPVKCAVCSRTFYGPTDDMRSERGVRFANVLHKHVAAAHPELTQGIIRMSDLFVNWCALTLFRGDANFDALLDDMKAELLKIVTGQSPTAPPQDPGNTVELVPVSSTTEPQA